MSRIKTNTLNEGFAGSLYPVKGRKDKVLITLSGSEGGLRNAQKLAHYHARQGLPALAIGYFGTKGTPKALSQIPLEYIEKAIKWLKQHGYQKIAVEGVSKGAEYALAAATTFEEISCVVLRTPPWFYGEGLTRRAPSNTSCWTYQGKALPYTPYKESAFLLKQLLWQAKEYNLLPINTGKRLDERSIIPIEKVNGPVLILSTQADTIWPSKESGDKLDQRLTQKNFPYPHKHICFRYMGHLMFENVGYFVRVLFKSERAHPLECAEERKQMGREVRDWLEHVW